MLREAREARGLTATQAAVEADISQVYALQLERTERPSGAGAIRYARVLGYRLERECTLTPVNDDSSTGGR
jgi:transcriptional regulator with XRE-family HTH domain